MQLQVLARVGRAMLLGTAIGFEREIENKLAGLRTHMLVGGAATLFVALGDCDRAFQCGFGWWIGAVRSGAHY